MTDDELTAMEAQHPCYDLTCTAQGCVSRRAITAHARELRAALRRTAWLHATGCPVLHSGVCMGARVALPVVCTCHVAEFRRLLGGAE